MCSGDVLGDSRERAEGFTLKLEPFLEDGDENGPALVIPSQHRAGHWQPWLRRRHIRFVLVFIDAGRIETQVGVSGEFRRTFASAFRQVALSGCLYPPRDAFGEIICVAGPSGPAVLRQVLLADYRRGPVVVVGGAGVDRGRGCEVASDLETRAFPEVSACLGGGVDAVSVAVPTVSHNDVVREVLRAGADVLVEKPMASTVEEARAMNDAAVEAGRLLQVGHVERFNGAVLALTEHITKPLFVECHRLSPFSGRGDDVSVVLDLMIHDLDVVLALTKAKVTSLDAVGIPVFSTQEDIANVRLRFDSGCVANLTASRISVDRMRKIRIFEENAYVSTDYSEQEVIVYHKKPGKIPEGLSPMEWIAIEPLQVSREEPLRLELMSFLECVRNRTQPLVSGEDGLRALELAFDILAFIRKNQ